MVLLLSDFVLLGGGLFGVDAGAAVVGGVAGGLVLAALGALVLAEGLAALEALPLLLRLRLLVLLLFVFQGETSTRIYTLARDRAM